MARKTSADRELPGNLWPPPKHQPLPGRLSVTFSSRGSKACHVEAKEGRACGWERFLPAAALLRSEVGDPPVGIAGQAALFLLRVSHLTVTPEMAKMARRKCAFCPDDEPCAIMYIAEERNLAVHQNCLLFSSGFVELEEQIPKDRDKRFDVASVVSEIKRGKRLLCNFCHKRGATIGCEIKNCRRSYHYFCAVCDDASIETDKEQGLYRLFCPKHIPVKRSSFYDENSKNAMPLVLTESSSTTTQMNDETVGEENMEVVSEKHDQPKERIEFLKKCKQAGLLNDIFEKMLNTLHLAQEKLMDDNTSEAEYEKTVISLFDCGLFENILRAAHSGTEKKIQELMNTREGLDAQIELLRDFKEIVFPVSENNTSSSISE